MLGKRLRLLREELNLKQTELAEQLKINRVTYNRYETGEREPDLETLKKIANFFNVSTDYLLGNSNVRTPISTIAAHRTDDPTDELPEDARKSIEDFKKFIFEKHGIKYD